MSEKHEIAVAIVAGFAIGVVIVTFAQEIKDGMSEMMLWPDIPSFLTGMAGGISFYLWRVTEGQPFRCVLAALHTGLGGFFGLLGAKAAMGYGANAELTTVASGIGGGLGPRAIDRIERMVGGGGK